MFSARSARSAVKFRAPLRMFLLALACAWTAAIGHAQEGHPLSGTWAGNWGPSASDRRRLTVVMTWDGQKVSGVINPGPESTPIKNVTIDFATWTVRIEAEARGVQISGEGRVDEVGSPHRTLAGTWRQGTT